MPITFNCPCGKALRIADENAGRRIKCPACQAVGTAPEAAPKFELIENDEPQEKLVPAKAKPVPARPAAKPAPDEGDAGFTVEEDEDEKPKAKKKPAFSKGSRRDEEEEEEEKPKKKKKPRRDDDDEPRPRRRPSDPDAGRKVLYLIGGLLMVVGGIALAVISWNSDSRRAIRGVIFGACLAVVGVGTAIKGITGNFDDDE